ncbi:NASP-related protein sim3 [Naviculisporaceae sp. PSN 640]
METPVQTSGTATPMDLDPEHVALSLKVTLADKSAKAAALYAKKNYEEAAEVYAQAAEMQAEMNGEMSPENAEILFLYGRALFKVGQSKSDVLGGKAPDAKKPKAKPAPKKASATNGTGAEAKPANGSSSTAAPGEAEAKVDEVVSKVAATEAEKKDDAPKKPLFQFEGDENFDDSEEDEDAEEGEGEEEEEEDDLAVSFEILDLARVLFNKKLEALLAGTEEGEGEGKGKEVATDDSPSIRHIKERLADTHDLLAEISLENERYPNAITDSRQSLKYKQQLFPEESEIVAEAHFKLSLALEFASMTKSSDESNEGASGTTDQIDQGLRDEAAAELQAAIDSTKLKLQSKEVELATLHNPEDNDLTRQQITEVKEIIADMEQRLVELKKPPVDLNQALGLPPKEEKENIQLEAPAEVKKNAHDLSGMVKKKRKAEDVVEANDKGVETKKVKEDESAVAKTEVPAAEA